jgi:hypothetical protein
MRTFLLAGVSSLLLGSPAISATYYVDGSGTGEPEQTISQDTPDSISGGSEGTTFTANATNVGGGSVSAFASEGLSDVTDYNNSAGSHYYGLGGGGSDHPPPPTPTLTITALAVAPPLPSTTRSGSQDR